MSDIPLKPEPHCKSQAGNPNLNRQQTGIKLSVLGIFAMVCKHGFFFPNGVVDFTKGEG